MNSEILEIIVKVLSGNASPAEKQRLRTWIDLDNENLAVFQQFEAIWNSFDIIKSEHEYNCEEAFERFKQQIDNRLKKYKKRGFLKKFDVVLRVAAVIIILLGIAYFFLRTEKSLLFQMKPYQWLRHLKVRNHKFYCLMVVWYG